MGVNDLNRLEVYIQAGAQVHNQRALQTAQWYRRSISPASKHSGLLRLLRNLKPQLAKMLDYVDVGATVSLGESQRVLRLPRRAVPARIDRKAMSQVSADSSKREGSSVPRINQADQ